MFLFQGLLKFVSFEKTFGCLATKGAYASLGEDSFSIDLDVDPDLQSLR